MQQASVSTMTRRHLDIDRRIDAEARRPGHDDLDLARMKRERLSLKDQLASIRD